MLFRTISILAVASSLYACGGATASTQSEGAAATSDELSGVELAKLDESLRDQLRHGESALFPVRVKFASRPSRTDLSELFLAPLDRDAVGRVDRATLKAIAARADVTHIVYVSAGYAEDDDEYFD